MVIAPQFVEWPKVVGIDYGPVFLRCERLHQFLFGVFTLKVGFVMVSRIRLIKSRICFPFQKTGLLWLRSSIITTYVIYFELSMAKEKTLRIVRNHFQPFLGGGFLVYDVREFRVSLNPNLIALEIISIYIF